MNRYVDAFTRFVTSVDMSAGPDECWVWKSYRTAKGYGQFQVDGKKKRAHRWMVEHILGEPLDPDLMVCHHCDNPPCIHPGHLFISDAEGNNRDKAEKGRHPGGWHGNQYTRRTTPTA